MKRLVSVDIQKGGTYYHFEDREKKLEYDKMIKNEKDIQDFKETLLGEPWTDKESMTEEVEC